MASKKTTKHHYVLVFTESGPKYVTKIGEGKTAYWNSDEKPYEMSEGYAESMTIGLSWNGFTAVHVVMPFEIESHPYRYSEYEIKWVEKGEKS